MQSSIVPKLVSRTPLFAVAAASRSFLCSSSSSSSSSISPLRYLGSTLHPYNLRHQLSRVVQDQAKELSSKRFRSGFCTSATEDLTLKKCVPCNSEDIRPMPEQTAHGLLPKVEGWTIATEDRILKLHRSWKVKSFTKGLEFFQLVADVAEAEGHHPDLHLVGWNNVKIDIWTHSVGGLTENDFILAAKINSLNVEGLLRRKATTRQ